jgi:ADP-ribose pyrophosphatase YjhB (NUDIX family)
MNPIYTHNFGVYALIESECRENILLIKKNQGPYKGLLDLPGGTPESYEILEQTLCRTVIEKTGFDVDHCTQHKTLSSLFEFHKEDKPHVLRHIGVLYHVNVSGELKLPNNFEENSPLWVKKCDILGRDVTPFVSLYVGK